jgi:signal transduction histidine kinase/PAS domain-containing protein
MPRFDKAVLAEPQRLAAARRARRMLPGLPMPLDAIARLAARVTGAPMAVVAVMDVEEEHFIGSHGLPERLATDEPMPVKYSLCKYVVSADHPVTVMDMAADPQLRKHALAVDFGVRAFAGVPLRDEADRTVGSLLVIDVVARPFTGEQVSLLVEISALLAGLPADGPHADATAVDDLDSATLIDGVQEAFIALDDAGVVVGWNPAAETMRDLQRALVDSLDSGVAAVDAQGRLMVLNRAMRRLHSIPDDSTAELSVATIAKHVYGPDGSPLPLEQVSIFRALRGEHVHDDEVLIKVPGERVRTLMGNAQPIISADGHHLGAVVALHEVTERRRIERFRDCQIAVATALAHAGTIERAASTITEAVARALGWPYVELWLADAVTDTLRLAGHRSDAGSEPGDFITRSIIKGEGISGTVWATAEPVWVPDIADNVRLEVVAQMRIDACVRAGLRTVLAVPIPDGERALGVLSCFADAPEFDRTQLTTLLGGIGEQIGQFLAHRRGERLTLEVARAKDDFLSLVGHEMRTPLTSISSYSDMLLDALHPQANAEDSRQLLEGVVRNTAVLRAIVDDLLDLSGMESGYLRITEQRINLGEITRQALRSVQPAAEANGVSIIAAVPDELITTGDPQRLRQVLDNLVSNAVKYSPDGGDVRIILTFDHEVITLTVTDNGIGIPYGERQHLFQRFYRAANARHSGIPGTGLGLTIVRAIVGAHHGTIALEDNPSVAGTTITVRIPNAAGQQYADTTFPDSRPT